MPHIIRFTKNNQVKEDGFYESEEEANRYLSWFEKLADDAPEVVEVEEGYVIDKYFMEV